MQRHTALKWLKSCRAWAVLPNKGTRIQYIHAPMHYLNRFWAHDHTKGQLNVFHESAMHVFELWVPRENPRRYEDNLQTDSFP